jgi:hypothetical protein
LLEDFSSFFTNFNAEIHLHSYALKFRKNIGCNLFLSASCVVETGWHLLCHTLIPHAFVRRTKELVKLTLIAESM